MQFGCLALALLAAGCADPTDDLSKPRATAAGAPGEVQAGVFSADSQALLGWVTPVGKDPAEVGRKSKPWVLWSATDGAVVARWTGDPLAGFPTPGASDGTAWPAILSDPPGTPTRRRLLDLATGTLSDVPGVAAPADCSAPSHSADRSRLAYSYSAKDSDRKNSRVYAKTATGWARLVEVPGGSATLSPDGKLVATVGRSEDDRWATAVRLFAVADGREKWAAKVDSTGLAGFTPDGRYVVQRDNAGHRLIDVATGKQAALIANGPRGDDGGPAEVAYRDGRVAAVVRTGDKAEYVRWNLATGQEVCRVPADCPSGRNRTPPFGSPVLAVVRTPVTHRSRFPRNATWDSVAVDVYDPAAPDPLDTITLGNGGSVVASPDGRTLAAIGYGSLAFYPLPAGK